ncbi:hypothetical protein FALB51S_04055 [Frigidibacter albus]
MKIPILMSVPASSGSRSSTGRVSVCGSSEAGSFSHSLMAAAVSEAAISDIIRPEITSLIPARARSSAGGSAQSAPAAAPASIASGSATMDENAPASSGAVAPAVSVPSRYCPSIPRFHRPDRKLTISAPPRISSGTMFTTVACSPRQRSSPRSTT